MSNKFEKTFKLITCDGLFNSEDLVRRFIWDLDDVG
jgi:hypothetical protein